MTAPAEAASPTTGIAAVEALFAPFHRSDAPGLVVGIAQAGRLLLRRGYGLASIEQGTANTPATRMRIGSTTKHFTCLAALLLAEEGKLDIDAGIRHVIPELPLLQGDPTLRQLMSHTGGHRCFLDLGLIANGFAIQPKGAVLAAQVRQTAANFRPGERMIYSNGGYQLLSMAIERASGMAFSNFLAQRIFAPLGLHDTGVMSSDFEIHPGMASLHVALPASQGGSWRRGLFPSEEMRGDGAMISTIGDMLRWLAHLRSPHKIVGSAASWQQMTTPARLSDGTAVPYALGLMVHRYRGVEVIHHAGGVIGGSSQMITVPSHALDIVILNNGAAASPVELAWKTIDALLEGELDPATEHASADRYRPLVGARYFAPASGRVIGFAETDGKLGLSFCETAAIPLAIDGDTLVSPLQERAYGPLVLDANELAGSEAPPSISLREGGASERFERLPAMPPSALEASEAGASLLGRYRAADLDAAAEIRFDADTLQLRIVGHPAANLLMLEALSADVFSWHMRDAPIPMIGVLSVEREAGRVTGFRLDTPRTRHLHFTRVP